MTAFDRLAATFLVAFVLGVPFVASLALSLSWAPALWRWAALDLSSFIVVVCADIAWNRIDHNRLLAAIHVPRALVIPERWRRGQASATWWVLLPSTLLIGGWYIPFLAPSIALLLVLLAKMRTEPVLNAMMYAVASGPAMGLLMSGLSRVHAPLTALPVSRRTVALAELRLTPAMLVTVGVAPVIMAHVVVRDATFTGRMALVTLALGCAGAVARVAFVRLVRSSNVAELRLRVAIPAVVGLVAVVAFSASAPPLAVGGFALLALACAAALAHTAPERPLSL